MALDPAIVAAGAAVRLHVTPADVQPAADAAVAYIATWCNVTPADLPDTDPLLDRGAVLLAERIYQDTGVPSGGLAAFGDSVLAGAVVPEDLARHLQHYWQHLQTAWGVA